MVVKTTKLSLGAAASGLALCLASMTVSAAPSEHEIYAVQNALYGAGFAVDQANGKMDSSTHKALRAYQKSHKLKVTGDIDNQTLIDLGVKLNAQTTANARVKATLASYGIGSAPAGAKPETMTAAASTNGSQSSAGGSTQAAASKENTAKPRAQDEKKEKKEKKKSGWWFW